MARAPRDEPLADVAARCVDLARRAGATGVAATATRSRQIDVGWRDGRLEGLADATQREVELALYLDGRCAVVSTSDLRPEALRDFIAASVAMARALPADPDRRLPDPALYAGRAAIDLELEDPSLAAVTADERKRTCQALEAAARSVPGAAAIASVASSVTDVHDELALVSSNGFAGAARGTLVTCLATVNARDPDGRRPDGVMGGRARWRADVRSPDGIGRDAAERALAQIGARKAPTGVVPVVVEHRTARRLVAMLVEALNGQNLALKRSFLQGQLDHPVGSPALAIADDPLVRRGLASALFDGEGLTTRPRAIVEAGVLRSCCLDTYYGRKLGLPPTSGALTNLVWKTGDRDLPALLAGVGEGILVTAITGGNARPGNGDFSFGVAGFAIRGGRRAEPVGEINVSGNQRELWKRLVAVGNDPWPQDAWRTPTLVFDGLQVAGS